MIKRRYYIKLQTEDSNHNQYPDMKPLTNINRRNRSSQINSISLQFQKNNKNNYSLERAGNKSVLIPSKLFKQICLVKYQNKDYQWEYQKYKNIFKLPKKYEKIKSDLEKNMKPSIQRPCRHHNFTQMKQQKGKVALNPKDKKNRKYLKMLSTKKIDDCEDLQKEEQEKQKQLKLQSYLASEIEKQTNLPNNSKLFRRTINFIESKVTKIEQIEKLKHILKIPIQKQELQQQFQYQKQEKAEQEIKQQEEQQQQPTKLQQKNPLKIPNFYMNNKIHVIHYKITQVISPLNRPILQKKYKLPNEEQLHKFITKYKPKLKEIQISVLMLSSLFEIQTQIQGSDYQSDHVRKTKIYFGEKFNGKYNGLGVLVTQFQIRQGTWQLGYQIKGIIKNSCEFYQGQMKNSLKHGYGESRYKNGQYYEGHCEEGLRSGNGYFKFSQAGSYFGEWKKGAFNGKGVFKNQISVYEGEFMDSKRNGFGKQKFQNGDYYEGNFVNNLPQGSGKYLWKCGNSYQGQFVKGQRQGYGVLNAPGSVQYLGNFKNDLPSGKGKAIYNNGDEYHGSFYQGERNGRGDLICKNSKKFYTGDWINDALAHQLS